MTGRDPRRLCPPARRRLDVWLEEQDERLAPGGAWERVAFWAVLIPAVAYLSGHVVAALAGR